MIGQLRFIDTPQLLLWSLGLSATGATTKKVWPEAELEALKDLFARGTQLAWVIDAELQRVEACLCPTRRQFRGCGGCLEGDPLLPAIHFPTTDLFKEWDWE